jgi:hypothetical protein
MIGGCTPDSPKPTAAGAGVLALGPKPEIGLEARLRGQVTLVDDCLQIHEAGADPVVPVFVEGTVAWDPAEGLTYAGKPYPEGSVIALTGGFSESVNLQVVSVPEACRALGRFFIVAS